MSFYVYRQLELAAAYLAASRLSAAKDCLLRVIEAVDRAIAAAEPSAATNAESHTADHRGGTKAIA